MPALLFWIVLVCSTKLWLAAGAVMVPPLDDPIEAVSAAVTWKPVARLPVNEEVCTLAEVSTEVPRICTRKPSAPTDPTGWQVLPTVHLKVELLTLIAVRFVLLLSMNDWSCGAESTTSFVNVIVPVLLIRLNPSSPDTPALSVTFVRLMVTPVEPVTLMLSVPELLTFKYPRLIAPVELVRMPSAVDV